MPVNEYFLELATLYPAFVCPLWFALDFVIRLCG